MLARLPLQRCGFDEHAAGGVDGLAHVPSEVTIEAI
jgi:hypothetical protein